MQRMTMHAHIMCTLRLQALCARIPPRMPCQVSHATTDCVISVYIVRKINYVWSCPLYNQCLYSLRVIHALSTVLFICREVVNSHEIRFEILKDFNSPHQTAINGEYEW